MSFIKSFCYALSFFLTGALSAEHYTTVEIPSLGGTFVEVFDINNNKVVVGTSSISSTISPLHAFRFDLESELLTDLGTLPLQIDSIGFGINDSGDIVGASGNPNLTHAYLLEADTTLLSDLGLSGIIVINGTPFLPLQSMAKRINDCGFISGTQICLDANFNARLRPMFFSVETGMIDLGTPSGTENGDVNDMNSHSVIVGYSFAPTEAANAFATIWHMQTQSPIGVQEVALIEGFPETTKNSFAIGINNHNKVVGRYQTEDDVNHAYLWTEEEGIIDLGTLHDEPGSATAQAINDKCVVAGTFVDAQNVSHVFAWKECLGMVEIGEELPPGSYFVRGINSDGIVIVSATDTGKSFAIDTNNLVGLL